MREPIPGAAVKPGQQEPRRGSERRGTCDARGAASGSRLLADGFAVVRVVPEWVRYYDARLESISAVEGPRFRRRRSYDRVILYRPVGLIEMRLIWESRLRAFPPRLPEQPIFYPVLNVEYASQIASRWNTRSSAYAGYVTKFSVDDAYAAQFERHIVGSRIHEELWIPAERLGEFNQHIVGPITVVAAFFGAQFRGYVPDRFGMRGRDAVGQFLLLNATLDDYAMDFSGEIAANSTAVFLHYPFWRQTDFTAHGIDRSRQDHVLAGIAIVWEHHFPGLPLPTLRE